MVHLLLGVIYLAFISLGLPDSLLGSAWPSMYGPFGVPVSFAGIISMIIAVGTIVSSLNSDRLTARFGPGRVTACSVALTALALFGFSLSSEFWMLCLWAVPYGLGAGSVDAALNNYVALHYASRHMSWLHCMWGVGTLVGPNLISCALSGGQGWQAGYRYISLLQVALTAVLVFSLPLWKRQPSAAGEAESAHEALGLRQAARIPGAKSAVLGFFCYCALEQTAGLWAGSYLVLHGGLSAERAAALAALFYIGITAGRAVSGFVSGPLGDVRMIRLGQGIILAGAAALLLPSSFAMQAGLVLVGLGCAPIYPSIIHATPARFGAARSQALIGLEMAGAYVGTCLMPPLFGALSERLSISLMPLYLLALLAVMFLANERANRASGLVRSARPARERG
ncbi:MAG TPA: MFS transporter [Candidatus Faecalibacterium faecigallinarum]|uniref:MFS transporter n=1 Tax=Candidatus Faecalibacterium faecigallinarum TaxID=2838577 RepID=A0A9D2T3N2_9FIRM|nr:MFS transporter [Candidatus Faecalibacterium faecigallinarum]